MKKTNLFIAFGITVLLSASLLFQNCAIEIETKCELQQYEGTYIGYYKVANLIDITDTITIVVDLESNNATVTSAQLDTFFVAKYLNQKFELTVDPIVIPVFQAGTLLFTNASIGGGYIKLVGACDELYVEMNRISVTHNFPALPNPLTNVTLLTPEFMVKL